VNVDDAADKIDGIETLRPQRQILDVAQIDANASFDTENSCAPQ